MQSNGFESGDACLFCGWSRECLKASIHDLKSGFTKCGKGGIKVASEKLNSESEVSTGASWPDTQPVKIGSLVAAESVLDRSGRPSAME